MSLMHAKYPNLELLEFKARVMLSKDSEFTEEVDKKRKENKYRSVEFEAIVFSQMWGSTCTGFDVLKDGSPAIGGCAMTKECDRKHYHYVRRESNGRKERAYGQSCSTADCGKERA